MTVIFVPITNYMVNHPTRYAATSLMLILLLSCSVSASVAHTFLSQREHLTPEEIEIVRDTQELDRRIAVFIKAVERRLMVLTNLAATISTKKKEKDEEEKWGAMPKGTRTQLLSDISRILDEAITNIDDSAARSPKSPLLPKSLRKLAESSNKFLPALTAMRDGAVGDSERDALEQAIENAQTVIEAAAKLPPPDEKK
jgi:hypothetical protein